MNAVKSSCIFLIIIVSSLVQPLQADGVKVPDGSYLIYDYGSSGMFAVFSAVLGSLHYYEQGNYSGIKIDLNNGSYLDPNKGPNWWEYFFEPIAVGNPKKKPVHVFNVDDHRQFVSVGFNMPRAQAFELIQRYVHIKPHIQEQLEDFLSTHFSGHYVIGVHHRGTDKVMEIPLVPYRRTCAAISTVIKTLSYKQKKSLVIFVATDDAHFITHMRKKYRSLIVCQDCVRSDNNKPLHYGSDARYNSNYQKGEEALLDCLLLSECDFLIRPQSSLSIAADHFNPNVPVVILEGN